MPEKLTQIPKDKLIEGRWYVGRGRNANVARWTRMGNTDRFTFLTVGMTFRQGVVKDEGYYETERQEGCFQPFALIEEGEVAESVGPTDKGWDKHYAKTLILPDRS